MAFYIKQWDPIFGQDRIPKDRFAWMTWKKAVNATGDDITALFQDDVYRPCFEAEDLRDFCQGSSLRITDSGPGSTRERTAAWLDERITAFDTCKHTRGSEPDSSEENTEKKPKIETYSIGSARRPETSDGDNRCPPQSNENILPPKNPLTATALYRYFQDKCARTSRCMCEDRLRRLVCVRNLDPYYILALAETAPFHQLDALRNTIWKHIRLQTFMGIKTTSNYKTFQLEFHLPHLTLSSSLPNRFTTPQKDIRAPRLWKDVSILNKTPFEAREEQCRRYIHQTGFSLTICGGSHWTWTAYAFVDDFEDDDYEDEVFQVGGLHEDPIALVDANLPLGDPREYFLMAIRRRVGEALEDSKNIVYPLEMRIRGYLGRQHCSLSRHSITLNETEALKKAIDWTRDTLEILQWIQESLSDIIGAWDIFSAIDGDIGFLSDIHSSPPTPAQLSLQVIKDAFDQLRVHLRKVHSLEKSCKDQAENLKLSLGLESNRLTLESNHLNQKSNEVTLASHETAQHAGLTGELTLSVVAPITIALAYFGVEQDVNPFRSDPKSLIACIAIISITIRAYIELCTRARRYGWWKRMRAWVLDRLPRLQISQRIVTAPEV